MAQEFWINRYYTELKGTSGSSIFKIFIPEKCPHCQMELKIAGSGGDENEESYFYNSCEHTSSYPQVWAMRLTDTNTTGGRAEASCKQCSRKNDLGVKKCYWCECPNPC